MGTSAGPKRRLGQVTITPPAGMTAEQVEDDLRAWRREGAALILLADPESATQLKGIPATEVLADDVETHGLRNGIQAMARNRGLCEEEIVWCWKRLEELTTAGHERQAALRIVRDEGRDQPWERRSST